MYLMTGIPKTLLCAVMICISLSTAGKLYADNAPFEYDIFIYDNRLTADINCDRLFSEEMVESIKEGLPLHIDLMVTLKKSHSLWFDPALEKHNCSATIEYKPFGARFHLIIRSFEDSVINKSYKNIDDLQAILNESLLLVCGDRKNYNSEDNLYFDFNLELRRLTAQEIENASDWYSGEIESDSGQKSSNFQQKIFEQLVDITGMGPVRHQFSGFIFKLIELKEVRP
ncbi:MAG: DUF4390 domain-containing protein [candidate division Zixibacteria bacterium]|nr:DUF4390 domain-containing protein [candidate division Zixibacteria bacterium]